MNDCSIEKIIALHCGPALAGIKPSNMVSICLKKYPDTLQQIHKLNKSLNMKNIYFLPLFQNNSKLLLLVFRKNKLEKIIMEENMKSFLSQNGYPMDSGLNCVLECLKNKLNSCFPNFPHEIGAFLGYPLDDIIGFVVHKGKNFKCSGYWKVYADADKAASLFTQYKKCSQSIYSRVSNGASIVQLFAA